MGTYLTVYNSLLGYTSQGYYRQEQIEHCLSSQSLKFSDFVAKALMQKNRHYGWSGSVLYRIRTALFEEKLNFHLSEYILFQLKLTEGDSPDNAVYLYHA